jgi:hypothetical protein
MGFITFRTTLPFLEITDTKITKAILNVKNTALREDEIIIVVL